MKSDFSPRHCGLDTQSPPLHNELAISLVQYSPVWEDVSGNLSRLSRIVSQLEGRGDLILLPEMFSTGFSTNTNVICTPKNQSTVLEWMRQTAQSTGSLIAGSVAVEENTVCYNRFYWVGADGSSGHYDKNYLFIMSDEPKYFTAGTEKKQFEWRGWKIKPIICYDLRFPELCRNTRNNPYDILVCVASWPSVRSDVWLTLLKARAIENQCYAIGVNRVGEDGNGLQHKGDTIVYSPKGETIVRLPENEEKSATIGLSLSKLKAFRQKFPVLEDIV